MNKAYKPESLTLKESTFAFTDPLTPPQTLKSSQQLFDPEKKNEEFITHKKVSKKLFNENFCYEN